MDYLHVVWSPLDFIQDCNSLWKLCAWTMICVVCLLAWTFVLVWIFHISILCLWVYVLISMWFWLCVWVSSFFPSGTWQASLQCCSESTWNKYKQIDVFSLFRSIKHAHTRTRTHTDTHTHTSCCNVILRCNVCVSLCLYGCVLCVCSLWIL